MPDAAPRTPPKAPAIIAAAVLVAAPLAAHFEGYIPTAKPDPVGIPTYCYGETELLKYDPAHIYSKSECMALLRARMKRDYAPKIAACIPEIVSWQRVNAFGALIDASYNAGWQGVCKSQIATEARRGQLQRACRGLASWYITARDRRSGVRKTLPGLVSRRAAEMALCLKDAA